MNDSPILRDATHDEIVSELKSRWRSVLVCVIKPHKDEYEDCRQVDFKGRFEALGLAHYSAAAIEKDCLDDSVCEIADDENQEGKEG